MHTRLMAAVSAIVATGFSLPAIAQPQDFRDWYAAMHYDADWSHMMGGLFMMVFFWGGLALVIYLVARWIGMPQHHRELTAHPGVRTPLDILKERFARGEIDKTEYEERKRVLMD